MKREILFRGQLLHSKEWIEGNLIIARNGKSYIIPFDVFEPDGHHLIIDSDSAFWVIPETVGQFTGLTDKNGINIFEGDLVKMNGTGLINKIEPIRRKTDYFAPEYSSQPISVLINIKIDFEVIGNIHDNPELL